MNITLILANNMTEGNEVISHYGLDPDKCAVITKIGHMDDVILIPNETVYAHYNTDAYLFLDFISKLNQMPGKTNVNLKMLKL
jgi:hypothetical protein